MSLLIINTLREDDEEAIKAIKTLTQTVRDHKVINTCKMNISHCCGCYTCVLKTPGECIFKDDYESILIDMLYYENIIFISDTAFGFVNSSAKKVVDRILPLITFFTEYRDGETRHVVRYKRDFKFGLIYKGNADNNYMNYWVERLAININGSSMGAYPVQNIKELI